jgi:O-antigen ligase
MLDNLKALMVVFSIAMAIFIVAKPICLRFMAEDDFARRRAVWIGLTLAGFLSPSFWLYFLVAILFVAWSMRKETNPAALYIVLMNVIPPEVGAEIPVVGINALFKLDNFRILAFVILLPVLWRLMHSKGKTARFGLTLMDWLILAYTVLHLILLMPYESFTVTLRRSFLFGIDALLLYFVVSRTCTSQRAIVEAMACYCLIFAVSVPIAVFEAARHWLLYPGIADQWDDPMRFAYAVRSGIVRAQVASGHSLNYGNNLAIAFGFWLYLRTRLPSAPMGNAIAIWFWLGMIAAYSRGPWVAAAALFFAFLALGPNGLARFSKALLVSALLAAAVLLSPLGESVIDNLPFVGTVGEENVAYRIQIIQDSWERIKENPFFGNPLVVTQLEGLRQGQGIIDLINTYVRTALFYGVVGLGLYLGFFLVGMAKTYGTIRKTAVTAPDLSLLGVSLFACMFALLLVMGMGGFGGSVGKMFYVLGGFAFCYAGLDQPHEAVDAVPASRDAVQAASKATGSFGQGAAIRRYRDRA